MNIKNWLTLTIRTADFNFVVTQPELLAKLRELTLAPFSGMNFEMDRMIVDASNRQVEAQVFLAYRFSKLVGWALLSKEDSEFTFSNRMAGFKKEEGWMFQVFVNPEYRRQGIGSELYKRARKLIEEQTICICPWDLTSRNFYGKFSSSNRIDL